MAGTVRQVPRQLPRACGVVEDQQPPVPPRERLEQRRRRPLGRVGCRGQAEGLRELGQPVRHQVGVQRGDPPGDVVAVAVPVREVEHRGGRPQPLDVGVGPEPHRAATLHRGRHLLPHRCAVDEVGGQRRDVPDRPRRRAGRRPPARLRTSTTAPATRTTAMIPPIATAMTGPAPPLPGGCAAVSRSPRSTGPPAVSTCTATVAGSRSGAGNVTRYRVPSAAVTWSNAPMTPEARRPRPSRRCLGDGRPERRRRLPRPDHASTTPAARIRSTTVAAGSPRRRVRRCRARRAADPSPRPQLGDGQVQRGGGAPAPRPARRSARAACPPVPTATAARRPAAWSR